MKQRQWLQRFYEHKPHIAFGVGLESMLGGFGWSRGSASARMEQ